MWEIFAYQNSASLFGILNGIAALSGAGDFKSALAMTVMFGFITAAVTYAFAPQKLHGWYWLASVTLVMSCLFTPRTTVMITDKTALESPKVVDNVPLGLAVLASATSSVGNVLTELFETAFQNIPAGDANLPAELTYQRNGLVFGSRIIGKVTAMNFMQPSLRMDLIKFLNNCVMPDVHSHVLPADLLELSDDLWSEFADTNPARFSSVTADGAEQLAPCPQVYISLSNRLNDEGGRMLYKLASSLHPTLPIIQARERVENELQVALTKTRIADASTSAVSIVLQGAMINAMRERAIMAGVATDDNASMTVGRAQAVALNQTNSSWLNHAKLAEQALPVVRNVIEAITYALFPLMVLLMLLSGGKEALAALKNYASILIWIQLWPPLYAVLNYMAAIYHQYDLAAAAHLTEATRGLTLSTMDALRSTALSGQAVVGYLTLMIPMLAWAAVKRMENLGSTMVGGLSQMGAAATTATSQAALGNLSAGGVSFNQQTLGDVRTSPFFHTSQSDATGNKLTSHLGSAGPKALDMMRHNLLNNHAVQGQVTADHVQQASKSVSSAESRSQASMEQLGATLMDAEQFLHQRSAGSSNSASSDSSAQKQHSAALSTVERIASAVKSATGMDHTTALHLGWGIAFKGFPEVGIGFDKRQSESIQKALDGMNSEELSNAKSYVGSLANRLTAANTNQETRTKGENLAAQLQRAKVDTDLTAKAFAEAVTFQDTVSKAYKLGSSWTIQPLTPDAPLSQVLDLQNTEPGSTQSAFRQLTGLLAGNQTTPALQHGDGSIPIMDREGIEAAHAARKAPTDADAIRERHGQNQDVVRTTAGKIPTKMPATPPTPGQAQFPTDEATAPPAIKFSPQGEKMRQNLDKAESDANERPGLPKGGKMVDKVATGANTVSDFVTKTVPDVTVKSLAWRQWQEHERQRAEEMKNNPDSAASHLFRFQDKIRKSLGLNTHAENAAEAASMAKSGQSESLVETLLGLERSGAATRLPVPGGANTSASQPAPTGATSNAPDFKRKDAVMPQPVQRGAASDAAPPGAP